MKYALIISLTVLCVHTTIFASGGTEKKEPAGNDRLAEADRLYNLGLKHRDRAWEYEKQADGANNAKDREVYQQSARREFELAIDMLSTATKQNSRHYEAFGSLGYAQRKIGDFKAALNSYDRSLKMRPDYSVALEYRAEAYLGLNRVKDARSDYLKLVKIDKDQARLFLAAVVSWLAEKEGEDPLMLEFADWIDAEREKLGLGEGKSW
jgi:tetratricopeptide (TPR) repeat protein